MSTVTVSTGLQRAARLIPFRARGACLTGDYGAVLSPVNSVPEMFREAQAERTAYYCDPANGWEQGFRCKPDHAPRYWVTSYGVVIAWVTLDGRTHYAHVADGSEHSAARLRHQSAIRASWPERFVMNSEGDPITMSDGNGGRVFAPAGSRQTCDAKGHVHVVMPDDSCNICEGSHVTELSDTYA